MLERGLHGVGMCAPATRRAERTRLFARENVDDRINPFGDLRAVFPFLGAPDCPVVEEVFGHSVLDSSLEVFLDHALAVLVIESVGTMPVAQPVGAPLLVDAATFCTLVLLCSCG